MYAQEKSQKKSLRVHEIEVVLTSSEPSDEEVEHVKVSETADVDDLQGHTQIFLGKIRPREKSGPSSSVFAEE